MSRIDPHPDASVLATFIDGQLESDQLDEMVRHIESCQECLEIVGRTTELAREVSTVPAEFPDVAGRNPETQASSRWLPMSMAAVVALVIALGVWSVWKIRGPGADPVAPLVSAMSGVSERPFEARLEGFPHAPLVVRRSAGDGSLDSDLLEARATAAEILDSAKDGDDARQQHAAGVAAMIAGDRMTAVEHFEQAIALDASSHRYWNDLAAALYERAWPADDRETLQRALDASSQALTRSPASPAALFNRGLILEALDRPEDAAESYKASSRADTDSQWSTEAARRALRVRKDG